MSFFAFELKTAAVKSIRKIVVAMSLLRAAGPATNFENIDDSGDEVEIKQLLLPPLLPFPPPVEAVVAGGALAGGALAGGSALALQAATAPFTTSIQTSSEKLLSTPSVL